jgi:WD40 repeat protein
LRQFEEISGGGPDWSPDGSQIAFHSVGDGDAEIWVMNADGTNPRQLTDNDAEDWHPAWSPDGRQIAFMSDRDGNYEIYIMDANGSEPQRLTDNSREDWEPDWSPDGTQLVFYTMQSGNYEIYTMNADGSDQQRLTHNAAHDIQPAWCPAPLDESTAETLAFVDSGQELGQSGNTDVALGDLDGDGDLDAFVGREERAEVYLNDGQGRFAPNGQNLSIASGWNMGVDLGDLDGDGDLDAFVVVAEGPGRVLFNQGGAQGGTAGSFVDSGQELSADSGFGFDLELGDVDGDGDLDAYGAYERANWVWLNDGQGGFSDSGQRLGEAITGDVALADLDGDGDLDALAGGWDEPAKVWLNDGQGGFTDSGHDLTPTSVHIHNLELGDLDGDGDLDVFMAIASGHPNQVWFNDGTGLFTDSGQQLHSTLGHGVALGDLDGDGDLDALMANGALSGSASTVWLNDGQGNFVDSGLRLGNAKSYGVALGDLDGDGDLDAFVANNSQHNVVWLNE